jgi:hypothetical protein
MLRTILSACFILTMILPAAEAQMRPPGYDRAVQMERERQNMSRLDRDSITLVDTVSLFDPVTYEESVQIIPATYSLREYLTTFWHIGSPDILLDGQPHVILDPKTYEEITIRLTPDNKVEVIPKKE